MTEHTYGEARAILGSGLVRTQYGSMGLPLADCENYTKSKGEEEANAKRIALTWNCHDDLLEALEFVVKELDKLVISNYSTGLSSARVRAKKAIAKAKGES